MKGIKKLFAIALSLVMTVGLFSGCSLGGWSDKDAINYVKASLDASTRGEFKDLAKISKSSEKEIKKQYNDTLDTTMEGFTSTGMDKETQAKYKELVVNLLKATKYDVTKAKKDDKGNFKVTVKIQPLKGLTNITSEIQKEITVENAKKAGVDLTDSAAITKWSLNVAYEAMKKHIDNPEYATSEEVVVNVTKKDKEYNVSETEFSNLTKKMMGEVS
jgi:hypothetical protein